MFELLFIFVFFNFGTLICVSLIGKMLLRLYHGEAPKLQLCPQLFLLSSDSRVQKCRWLLQPSPLQTTPFAKLLLPERSQSLMWGMNWYHLERGASAHYCFVRIKILGAWGHTYILYKIQNALQLQYLSSSDCEFLCALELSENQQHLQQDGNWGTEEGLVSSPFWLLDMCLKKKKVLLYLNIKNNSN